MGEPGHETSGVTTRVVVLYVRKHGGDQAVAAMLEHAGETRSADELLDEHGWSSYEQKVRLFRAAVEILGDLGRSAGSGSSCCGPASRSRCLFCCVPRGLLSRCYGVEGRRPTMGAEETDLPKLAAPARRALLGAGYTRLERLTTVKESEVMKLHGMGPKAMDVLRHALRERGLSFAMEDADG